MCLLNFNCLLTEVCAVRVLIVTLRASEAAAQCIVIGPVCGFVCGGLSLCVRLWVCLWVYYHDNSKLRASILTKMGFHVNVVTISS